MARVYALLLPNGGLLTARPRGDSWIIANDSTGIEAKGRNLTVFLNGIDVQGLRASLPARNEREARRAAPFAVEEEIAESIEDSHVALADADRSDSAADRLFNIISRTTFSEITAGLDHQGFEEAEIVAAHSVLPDGDVLYEAPGLVLGRLGARAFSIDPGMGRDVLIGISEAFPDIRIHGEQVARALGREASAPGAASPEEFLTQLADWASGGGTYVNLRQGDFEARRSIEFGGLTQWRFAGVLAAVAAIGWLASVQIETSAMNARAQGLETLTGEFAASGWPEMNGDVRQILALSGNPSGISDQPFLNVLDASAALYDAIEQVEGSELRSIRYDRVRRQMTASLAFDSFADVDRLTAILNAAGLSARSGDARQSGSKVIGDLTLEGGR